VWHDPNNTTAIVDAPSFREALVIGGIEWDVALEPMRTTGPNGNTIEIPESIARAVVRQDRGSVLGVVGADYTPIQNRDAFAILEPLIDAGLLKLETGGSLRGGADVWMMGAWDFASVPGLDETLSAGGLDPVKPYSLVTNNHTGKRKVSIRETPIRVVCANTLGFAHRRGILDKSIAIPHTKNVASRFIAAAEEMFASVIARYTIIGEQYAAMRALKLTEEEFRALVLDVLAPLPSKKENSTSRGRINDAHHERATARATAKRDRLVYLWANGKGHTGDGSAWEAYNAAVESLDHDDLWKIKSESRIEAQFDGSLGRLKEAVAESVIPFAMKRANGSLAIAG
jgi:phage/plasmid-like protein (TIGR03299 family)